MISQFTQYHKRTINKYHKCINKQTGNPDFREKSVNIGPLDYVLELQGIIYKQLHLMLRNFYNSTIYPLMLWCMPIQKFLKVNSQFHSLKICGAINSWGTKLRSVFFTRSPSSFLLATNEFSCASACSVVAFIKAVSLFRHSPTIPRSARAASPLYMCAADGSMVQMVSLNQMVWWFTCHWTTWFNGYLGKFHNSSLITPLT